jgi:hypothetical protein
MAHMMNNRPYQLNEDILRVSKLWLFYRYPWISQLFQGFKSADLLEIQQVLELKRSMRYIAD